MKKQISSVAHLCPIPCNPMDCSTPCPSPTPRACSNSCPSSWWCHPTISSSVIPFSSYFQSCQASGSFPISRFFTSGGQSIRVSASASTSVPPMNIQGWFPLGLTGLISLPSKGLSRVFPQHHNSKASILSCSAFFMIIDYLIYWLFWKNSILIKNSCLPLLQMNFYNHSTTSTGEEWQKWGKFGINFFKSRRQLAVTDVN